MFCPVRPRSCTSESQLKVNRRGKSWNWLLALPTFIQANQIFISYNSFSVANSTFVHDPTHLLIPEFFTTYTKQHQAKIRAKAEAAWKRQALFLCSTYIRSIAFFSRFLSRKKKKVFGDFQAGAASSSSSVQGYFCK